MLHDSIHFVCLHCEIEFRARLCIAKQMYEKTQQTNSTIDENGDNYSINVYFFNQMHIRLDSSFTVQTARNSMNSEIGEMLHTIHFIRLKNVAMEPFTHS